MALNRRIAATLGALALAATLGACGGEPPADGTDPAEGGQADDGKLSFSEINADTVAGTCQQAFGSIAELYETLAIDVPPDAEFGSSDEENGGWADEYFPDEASKPATLRCKAPASYEDDSGRSLHVQLDILVAAGDSAPRGNTDFTVSADGMTAGLYSYSEDGSNYEYELVDQSSGEQFLTDDVLPQFTP